jgi:hypothetical protein
VIATSSSANTLPPSPAISCTAVEEETERVAWIAGWNLDTDDPERAAVVMHVKASQTRPRTLRSTLMAPAATAAPGDGAAA